MRRPVVLCYHLVSPTYEHRLSISPALLLRQVRFLSRFRDVRVTFDDGFRNSASVFPGLRQLGVSIQLFICSGYARDGRTFAIPELEGDDPQQLATMTWEELRAHAGHGVEIGAHTVSHPHLQRLGDDELVRELGDSKQEIEDELGRPCPDFAYPYGEHDDRVRAATRAAGYERAYGLLEHGRDRFALRRCDLYRRHTPVRALLRLYA